MERRSYLAAVGTVTAAGFAGCVSELGADDGGNGDDDDGGNDDDGNEDETGNGNEENGAQDDEHGAVEAVEAYMAAAADEDLEAMADAMHTHHPFDPAEMAAEAEDDEDTTFEMDDVGEYTVELADEAYETDEIHDLPYAEFWFQDIDLDDVLEGEDAALVTVETETTIAGETVTESETLIALTEDGEWRVFLPYEESTELPDSDPVDDETYRVVDELEFDADDEMVRVTLIDSIDSSIEEIVAYSESQGRGSSVYEPEDSDDDYTIPATWFSSPFDPDGDEIVVTVIVDGEELVVHRETYQP
ncbi:hypothetical protein [Natronorubrum tibetense]|uniref:Uncharacterized protein n=1 Tax=Natronorubrum tibetense GA33 TaxID=1114856 RepID=L9VXF3_9EURY|nr:hypothetical protein [Natronorubrum tibetense]ELY41870.1 hypothetical protein C496_08746 [Natronorubrum tibetense GA33]